VLIKSPTSGNNQVVHFGGDSGKAAQYRKELIFAHNTVVSSRRGNTVLFRRSHAGAKLVCVNNLAYVTPEVGRLSLLNDVNVRECRFDGNWFSRGWRISPGSGSQTLPRGGNLSGIDPGFLDVSGLDLRLAGGSSAIGVGRVGTQTAGFATQYRIHQRSAPRGDLAGGGRPDIGAFSDHR